MTKDLKNKTVVVTGGAEGIGYQIVDGFLKNGVKQVIILDINEAAGNEAVKILTKTYGDKVFFFKCDVTKDLEDVSKTIFDKFAVDVLVNNAGIFNEFETRKTIEINVTALIEWSYKFWEYMRTDKGGKGGTIFNVASIYGYRTDPFVSTYNASKFAVMGFTRSLGHEYNFKRFGVRVIAICPSYTETPLAHNLPDYSEPARRNDLKKFLDNEASWQTPEVVGKAAVEIFQRAESGEAWKIEGGKPIERVDTVVDNLLYFKNFKN